MTKLWGGRFAKQTADIVRQFNDSLHFDMRLYEQDIRGSQAWARAQVQTGVLTAAEAQQLVQGLDQVRQEIQTGQFQPAAGDEDVHTAVERRLTEIVGSVGGKLHTGRSRNDQVATDLRLWVKEACHQVMGQIKQVQQAMITHAEAHLDTPLPGYTHLQHAQPITWGHWLLSHFWPLERDRRRFYHAWEVADESPLGAAALAGTAYPIDRQELALDLGFGRVSANSLDAVSNRDFVADFLYSATMLGLHLSRLSEQLIIFSSTEFGFVRLDDAYSTGSSLMPQKKNPDTLELTRGKSGRLLGNLTGFLATLKGLPSSYDKDLQEDKEPLFDTYDNLMLILPVMAGVIETLTIQPGRMANQLEANLLATDLADYLVKKGVPFREAHHAVGQVVQLSEERDVPLTSLSPADLHTIHPLFGEDVSMVWTVAYSLNQRNVAGGTGPEAVRAQLGKAKRVLMPDDRKIG